MKKYCLICAFITMSVFAYSQEGQRQGLAILQFTENGTVEKDSGTTVADAITNLINSDQYFVVERQKLSQVMKEKLFRADNILDRDAARDLRFLGVSFVMLGNVSKIEGLYYGGYRIVNVETAKIGIKDSIAGAATFHEFIEKIHKSLLLVSEQYPNVKPFVKKPLKSNSNRKIFIETLKRNWQPSLGTSPNQGREIPDLQIELNLKKPATVSGDFYGYIRWRTGYTGIQAAIYINNEKVSGTCGQYWPSKSRGFSTINNFFVKKLDAGRHIISVKAVAIDTTKGLFSNGALRVMVDSE